MALNSMDSEESNEKITINVHWDMVLHLFETVFVRIKLWSVRI